MSDLPKSWLSLPLSEVIQTQKGKKPINLGSRSETRTIPYINIAAFETKVVGEYASEQNIQKCESTDTLLVWDGARAGLSGRGISGYIGSTLARVTSDLCDPSYLFYFINSNYETLNSQTKGVGIPHINPVVLNELKFPLAPIPEQVRIVEKLEELLSELDAGMDELKSAQAKLVQYRQSLLKFAVEGTLTAEWRTKNTPKETGEESLQRILKERRKNWEDKQLAKYKEQGKEAPIGWLDKYPEPVQPDTKDLPVLPKGWVWATIDQLSIVVRGASPRPAGDPRFFGGDISWITVGSITKDDEIYLTKTEEFLTEAGKQASRYIEEGTLLLTNSGATLGVPKITRISGCINDGSVALLDINDVIKLFLYWHLKTQTESLRSFNQGAAQPNLNTTIVKKIVVPFCSENEMIEILRIIDLAISNAKLQENSLLESLKKIQGQRKNIIKEAFNGKLVNQNTDDESASILLARIRVQRKQQQSLPKQKKVIKKSKDNLNMAKTLIEVLTESGDWLAGQEVFRRCGMSDGASTDEIEAIYSQLRQLDQAKKLEVNTAYFDDGRKQFDRIRLIKKD